MRRPWLADELHGFGQCGDTETEGALDEARLSLNVVGNIEERRLVFAERAHHLEAFDCRIGGLQRLEASDRADQLLQLAVIGLDDVVEIFHLPMLRVLRTLALLLQLGERRAVGRGLVGVDDARLLPILQAVQRLAEKALGRLGIARRREIKVDRVPELVDGAIEIGPPAPHLHVCLVDAPAHRARPAPLPAQALLDLRSVLLDPSENRRVVDRDAALAHHLLKVAIAHPVAAVPARRPEYDLALEVASLEVRHGSTLPPRPHPAGPRQDLQQSQRPGSASITSNTLSPNAFTSFLA